MIKMFCWIESVEMELDIKNPPGLSGVGKSTRGMCGQKKYSLFIGEIKFEILLACGRELPSAV
jgi:hypothetical protein